MEAQVEKKSLKQRLFKEFSEYLVNAAYLTLFFCLFAISRRLILSQYNIHLDDYFVGIIKALVIAKVIMLASFLSISRKFEGRPLIYPVLFKVFVFFICVALFDVVEGFIRGWIAEGSLMGGVDEILHHHFTKMWLGGALMVLMAFIPFFALKELSRIVGHEKFRDLFLKQGSLSQQDGGERKSVKIFHAKAQGL